MRIGLGEESVNVSIKLSEVFFSGFFLQNFFVLNLEDPVRLLH